MANHGSNFAHWLRDKLMKHYNLFEVDSVYLDSVVMRSGQTEHSTKFEYNLVKKPGVGYVSPDKRPHIISPTGAHPIGALREDWNELYKNAMKMADVMIFVYTSEFSDSVWCMQEFVQFHLENGARLKANKKPLRGIVLDFIGQANLFGVNERLVDILKVNKTDGNLRGFAWDYGDFILNEIDFLNLTQKIRTLA